MVKNILLIDTNKFTNVFFQPKNKAHRFYIKFLFKTYDIKHNIITLLEISRNYRLKEENRNKIFSLMNDKSIEILTPDLSDWRNSAKLIDEYKRANFQGTKDALRKMQMDCLIASIALRNKAAILTEDKDFNKLKKLNSGKKLKILSYGEYKYL